MRLRIQHQTSYHFEDPVYYALQQLRLRPLSTAGQSVLDWNLQIDGGSLEVEFNDQHGNLVDLVSVDAGQSEVHISCAGEVETSDQAGIVGRHEGYAPLWYFESATQLTQAGAGTRKLLKGLDAEYESDIARLHALSALVLDSIRYETDHTHAATTAEEAIAAGRGVCQDHAHVFIAAARALGYPARYVSGYLMMTDRVDQDASHAWAEAHLDGIGWVGFDIANGISPDPRYVRVATGLDYREAAPISGLRLGDGDESMVVTLQVEQ